MLRCVFMHLNPQLERNCRRPLDRSDGRTSLDSDPNRWLSVVPRLQKPRQSWRGMWQEEESWCCFPGGKQAREEVQSCCEGGGEAGGCDYRKGHWGGRRDAERLLPAKCEACGSVQGMGSGRPPLQAHCRHLYRCACMVSLITHQAMTEPVLS